MLCYVWVPCAIYFCGRPHIYRAWRTLRISSRANPFSALRFLRPLLRVGAVFSAAMTGTTLYHLSLFPCEEGSSCMPTRRWLEVQAMLMVVQWPVRIALMRGFHQVEEYSRSVQQAADALGQFVHSRTWNLHSYLGGMSAIWLIGGSAYMLWVKPMDDRRGGRLVAAAAPRRHRALCGLLAAHRGHLLLVRLPLPLRAASRLHQHGRRATTEHLVSQLPTLRYGACDETGHSTHRWNLSSCIICLGDFADGENVTALPSCGHYFHRECVAQWLARRHTCPLCQRWDSRPIAEQMRTPMPRDAADDVTNGAAEGAEAAAEGELRHRRHHVIPETM